MAVKENLKLRIAENRAIDESAAKLAAELHTVETIRIKRDMAKLKLARTEIRSPADGVVMERMTEPGAKLYVNMNERNSAQSLLKTLQPRETASARGRRRWRMRRKSPGIGQKARVVVRSLATTWSSRAT